MSSTPFRWSAVTGRAASTSTATASSGRRSPAAVILPASTGPGAWSSTGRAVRNGRQCDEGWTLHKTPGPLFAGTDIGTDFHYYNWVDQFNTLGLGKNVPIANGSSSDSLLALDPETGEWVILRVPYPQGFHSRGLDGRIDDPTSGWKGRGVYATYGADAAWHVEGGPVEPGNLVKFQIRPDPLAR